MQTRTTKIQLRRDTAANWALLNPILLDGEEGYETDTDKRKVGNGETTWNALPYSGLGGGVGTVVQTFAEKTDDYLVLAADNGKMFLNTNADKTIVYLLPSAGLVPGVSNFKYLNTGGDGFAIAIKVPNGFQAFVAIYGGGGLLDENQSVTSDTEGGEYAECSFMGSLKGVPSFFIKLTGNWS